jgi:hypothetical protein
VRTQHALKYTNRPQRLCQEALESSARIERLQNRNEVLTGFPVTAFIFQLSKLMLGLVQARVPRTLLAARR